MTTRTRTWLLGFALAVAAAISGCGSQPISLPSGHSALQSIIEDELFLRSDPVAALRTFKALGVDRVRVFVGWNSIAPYPDSPTRPVFNAENPAAYAAALWAPYDRIVRDATATGIGLDLTVGAPPPLWAAGRGAPSSCHQPCYQWKPSARQFGEFIHALGTRYSGRYVPAGARKPLPRVNFWAIWNEPNYGPYLAPQAIDHSQVEEAPRLYRGLLDAAWTALQATGHTPSTDTILFGETAPRGLTGPSYPGNFSGMVPLRFIRALYCVDGTFRPLRGAAATARGCPPTAAGSKQFETAHPALFHASGFADHPYPDKLAPDDAVPGGTGDADFASLGNLERTLDRAATAYGSDVRLPIYSTEFGYRSDPPGGVYGVPLAIAAAYLNQAEYLSWRNPRIRSYDQYLLTDPPASSDSLFVTGLRFAGGRPKPSIYDAYRMPLWLPVARASPGTALVVWGDVRQAPLARQRTGAAQHVEIQFAPAGKAFRDVRTVELTDPHGYFEVVVKFPGSGSVRLAWSGSGPDFYSRTETITLR